MDRYVTGAMIKRLREKCGLTQAELEEHYYRPYPELREVLSEIFKD